MLGGYAQHKIYVATITRIGVVRRRPSAAGGSRTAFAFISVVPFMEQYDIENAREVRLGFIDARQPGRNCLWIDRDRLPVRVRSSHRPPQCLSQA